MIAMTVSPHRPCPDSLLLPFSPSAGLQAREFHRGIPGYAPTALHSLPGLADAAGIQGIYVKDESTRFRLNSFKSLGATFAVACLLKKRLGLPSLSYESLVSAEVQPLLSGLTLITATDGNHGRGVAFTAKALGMHAVVYLPRGTVPERLQNIRALGADASILDLSYDECVEKAAQDARDHGWLLIQDTSFDGYEEVPRLIMQGYTTIGAEILSQLGDICPTHIFLQAGVGSMAAAMTAFFHQAFPGREPVIVIVEPEKADCLFQTAKANDGSLHCITSEMNTIMAGLACGVPCSIAADILLSHADYFAAIPDGIAATGMRILANPLPGDPSIVSGESGASAFGTLMALLRNTDPHSIRLRNMLGLSSGSRVLVLSTEGATDRENYRRILWDGAFPG